MKTYLLPFITPYFNSNLLNQLIAHCLTSSAVCAIFAHTDFSSTYSLSKLFCNISRAVFIQFFLKKKYNKKKGEDSPSLQPPRLRLRCLPLPSLRDKTRSSLSRNAQKRINTKVVME